MKVYQVTWHNTVGKRKDGSTHVIADSFMEVVDTFEELYPKRTILVIALVSTSVIEKGAKKHSGFHLPGADVAYSEDDE